MGFSQIVYHFGPWIWADLGQFSAHWVAQLGRTGSGIQSRPLTLGIHMYAWFEEIYTVVVKMFVNIRKVKVATTSVKPLWK